jgi:uncharacterized protein YbjT (DUF2867 family)
MNASKFSPVLFLGAPGLIGRPVTLALIKSGFSVLASGRRGLSVDGAPGIAADTRDPKNLYQAMESISRVALVVPDVADMESLGLNVITAAKAVLKRLISQRTVAEWADKVEP